MDALGGTSNPQRVNRRPCRIRILSRNPKRTWTRRPIPSSSQRLSGSTDAGRRTNLNVDWKALPKTVSDLADCVTCMSVEYLEVLDLLFREERTGHRPVEFPRSTVHVENPMAKKRAHKSMKPIPCKITQPTVAPDGRGWKQTFTEFLKIGRQYHLHSTAVSDNQNSHNYRAGARAGRNTNLDICRLSGEDLRTQGQKSLIRRTLS